MSHNHFILNITQSLDMSTPSNTPIYECAGGFELSITGTWTGTITVFRRADSSSDWGIAKQYTENEEDSAVFQTTKTNSEYMIASYPAGGTGTAVIRVYK